MNHFIGWRMQHKISHISKSTYDIYIGNVASGTAGLNVGTCYISKCQIGSGSLQLEQQVNHLIGLLIVHKIKKH